jgi:hypothetical protein
MSKETRLEGIYHSLQEQAKADRRAGCPGASADAAASVITGFLEEVCQWRDDDRRRFISTLTKSESQALLSFGRTFATRGLRKNCAAAVRLGLLALLFENRAEDNRETLCMLCLLSRTASIIGVDIEKMFREVQDYGFAETVEFFENYFRHGSRNPRDFGFREVRDATGFRYEQIR